MPYRFALPTGFSSFLKEDGGASLMEFLLIGALAALVFILLLLALRQLYLKDS